MKQPYWLFVLYNLTFIPACKRIARAFKERSPIPAIIITQIFTPFAAMLYVGRWKRAVLYLVLMITAIVYGNVMTQFNPKFLDMKISLLDLLVRLIASIDIYFIAKERKIPTAWYSRWYSIVLITMGFIATVFLAMFSVQVFFFGILHTSNNSMAPALAKDDYYVIYKTNKNLERGDIVVHRYPGKPQFLYTLRIIGKPDDQVKMLQGHIYINNEPVIQTPVQDKVWHETMPSGVNYDIFDIDKEYTGLDHFPNVTVPPGHYFLMGDNRDRSYDSRNVKIGPIPEEDIIGKVIYVCRAPCKLFGK